MSKRLLALTGELLLISATLIGFYLTYQAWFTNFESDRVASSIAEELKLEFSSADDQRTPDSTESKEPVGFALLYIPSLREDVWGLPILSDVSNKSLASGVGHYPSSALPGEPGNFAVAGHRATNGEPFARFEKLRVGDLIYVQTAEGFFTYSLLADQKIPETDVWVLDSKPAGLVASSESLITLTTCDPRWNSTQRWARWGELVAFSKGAPEGLTQ